MKFSQDEKPPDANQASAATCVPRSEKIDRRLFSIQCSGDGCPSSGLNQMAEAFLKETAATPAHFTANRDGKGTHFEVVIDLGACVNLSQVELVGHSTGYWCEANIQSVSTKSPGWCHGDNRFTFAGSGDAQNYHSNAFSDLTAGDDNCYFLDNGCRTKLGALQIRYLKITVNSECLGCINDDYVSGMTLRH